MMEEKPLNDEWTFWFHLPHDTNWTLKSYTRLCTVNTVEGLVRVVSCIESIVPNCMIFMMKGDITPLWEDPANVGGGAYSYKICENVSVNFWNTLIFLVAGVTYISDDNSARINGVTISPKKNFHIIKVWMAKGDIPEDLNDDIGIAHDGRVFTAFT
jgi:hypothetical protein